MMTKYAPVQLTTDITKYYCSESWNWVRSLNHDSERQRKGSVKEPNIFHNCETEKITRKASDVAENLQ